MRTTLLTVVLGSVSVAAVVVHGRNERRDPTRVRVLFVGNGIVDRHDLPSLLRRLAASDDPAVAISVDRVTESGATLSRHLNRRRAPQTIAQGRFDFVVLQEQSMVARGGADAMRSDLEKFKQIIHASGATPVLMSTAAPAGMSRLDGSIAEAYDELARSTNTRLAPTGRALAHLRSNMGEGIQRSGAGVAGAPGVPGAYLSACVLYETLTGNDCRGLSSLGLVEVPPRTAAQLQRIAHETVLETGENHR